MKRAPILVFFLIILSIVLYIFLSRRAFYQGIQIHHMSRALEYYIHHSDGGFPNNWDDLFKAGLVQKNAEGEYSDVQIIGKKDGVYSFTGEWCPINSNAIDVDFGVDLNNVEMKDGELHDITSGKKIQLLSVPRYWAASGKCKTESAEIYNFFTKMNHCCPR